MPLYSDYCEKCRLGLRAGVAQLAQAVPLLEAMKALTYRRFLSPSAASKSSQVQQFKPVGAFPDSPLSYLALQWMLSFTSI